MSQPPVPPQPGQQYQQMPYPPQQPGPTKKKWFKRPLTWIIAAIVVIAIAVNGGGGDSETVATSDTTTSEAADPAEQAEAQARADAEAALKDPSNFTALAERDLALLIKDPEAHKGEQVMVYGYVQQLDSATGPDLMLAGLSATGSQDWYDFSDNAMVFAGEPGMYADLVEEDLVTIYATVEGSISYDTQIGGNTSVPKLTAHIVEVTGSTA